MLIQLQFVKKELLVAMQAIDDLFNANQVNLQLLAVTPAILALFSLQMVARTISSAIKSTARGKVVEGISAVHRELRMLMREIERFLSFHDASEAEGGRKGFGRVERAVMGTEECRLQEAGLGQLLSILHRIQSLLVLHSASFDQHTYQQLQEDLRDLVLPRLTVRQRLQIVDRIYRTHYFLQPPRRVFGGTFLQ